MGNLISGIIPNATVGGGGGVGEMIFLIIPPILKIRKTAIPKETRITAHLISPFVIDVA